MIHAKANLCVRYENNPIMDADRIPASCFAVYNGGAVKAPNGYVMMMRMETMARDHYCWVARSNDGIHFTPDPDPVRFTASDMGAYNEYTDRSFYDPRINPVDGGYFITYCAKSRHGCRIGLGKTTDFKTVEHVSFPLHIQNRNAVLFPEKIAGRYVMLHRPQPLGDIGNIWIASSPDLIHWGDCKCIAETSPENIARWDMKKIGPGAPPVKTPRGWLVIYHGVYGSCNGHVYGMGCMLLDLIDPSKVIGRGPEPILMPKAHYERDGQVDNVIFPAGTILEDSGELKIYYGAADQYECLAFANVNELVSFCLTDTR